jgi:hypothetical protein
MQLFRHSWQVSDFVLEQSCIRFICLLLERVLTFIYNVSVIKTKNVRVSYYGITMGLWDLYCLRSTELAHDRVQSRVWLY